MSAESRRAEVLAAIDQVIDPCSAGIGAATGLAAMGLVERVDIDDGIVSVVLTTTSPACMFVGSFETEAEARVASLDWVMSVTVATDYAIDWDESRMSERARRRLDSRHVTPRGEMVARRVTERRQRIAAVTAQNSIRSEA